MEEKSFCVRVWMRERECERVSDDRIESILILIKQLISYMHSKFRPKIVDCKAQRIEYDKAAAKLLLYNLIICTNDLILFSHSDLATTLVKLLFE